MSDSNRAKSGLKFRICKCCAKRKRANSVSDAIESYFGKDFTEYEYVIENLAIRPVPKKLLDLVPVHSTTTSRRDDVYDLPCNENPSEPLKKQNTRSVLDWEEDSPPLKILSDDNEDDNKVMISDLDQSSSANPQVSGSNHRKSDTKPEEPPPKICDPPNINKIPTDDSQYPRQVQYNTSGSSHAKIRDL
ncbi:hypothetical protein GWI33_000960 [Rhynchophorus ferrugineus]|uniref:Uncharacterized protein n=1 Tax=Rhynchophorus ferrugineus TaxID=354439 RepID=A0A834HQE3_RHYFE|nr:hypothetical protein GWI33_000960 [Rhynchophorus ferrugineus]